MELDDLGRRLDIVDRIDSAGTHVIRMAFHLGPAVQVVLEGAVADLTWSVGTVSASARFELPAELDWTAHRGESEPVLGWYSRSLREKGTVYLLARGGLRDSRFQQIDQLYHVLAVITYGGTDTLCAQHDPILPITQAVAGPDTRTVSVRAAYL